jgi:hypothetical protein
VKNLSERFTADAVSGQVIKSISPFAFVETRLLNEVVADTPTTPVKNEVATPVKKKKKKKN